MKKILIYILCFIISGVNISYADDGLQIAPKLITSTSNSLTVTWEKNDAASGYYLYYGEKSGKNTETSGEIITENRTTITGLKPGTTYYIVVSYLDKKTNKESVVSPEATFNTKVGNNEKFALSTLEVLNASNLELKFNFSIDQSKDSVREFKITKNNKKINEVTEIKLDKNDDKKLRITLEETLEVGEYKIIVIYMTDSLARNIEEGINGELKFEVTEDKLNAIIDSETEVPVELIEENEEYNSGDTANYGLVGKPMTGALLNGDVVAGDSKKLPQTGPESIIIVFISLIIGMIYIKNRKTV